MSVLIDFDDFASHALVAVDDQADGDDVDDYDMADNEAALVAIDDVLEVESDSWAGWWGESLPEWKAP